MMHITPVTLASKLFSKAKKTADVFWVTLPSVLIAGLNFFFGYFVVKKLPTNIYGGYALALTVTGFISSFSDAGLKDFLLSKKSIDLGLNNQRALNAALHIFGPIISIAAAVYIGWINNHVALVFCLSLIPEVLALGYLQKIVYLNAQLNESLADIAKKESISRFIYFFIKFIVFYTSESLWAALLSSALYLLLFYGYLHLYCNKKETQIRIDIEFTRRIISSAHHWIIYSISFLSFFIYSSADRLIMSAVLGNSASAPYYFAATFLSIGEIPLRGLWSIYMPKISQHPTSIDRLKFIKTISLCGLSAALIYYFPIRMFVEIIAPPSYRSTSSILKITSWYFIFRFANVAMEIILISRNKYKSYVTCRIIAGALSIALNYIFIGKYGLLAAALNLVLAEASISLFSLTRNRKEFYVKRTQHS